MPGSSLRRCLRHPWQAEGPNGCVWCKAIADRKSRLAEQADPESPVDPAEQAAGVDRMLGFTQARLA